MIGSMLSFFRREKKYILFFIVIAALYGYVWKVNLEKKTQVAAPAKSEAVTRFEVAEKKFQDTLAQADGIKRIFEKNPIGSFVWTFTFFLVVAAFCIGITIDLFLVFSPEWRRQLVNHDFLPPYSEHWQLSLLFKVILWWLFGSVFVHFLFVFIKRILAPDISGGLLLLVHTTIANFICVGLIFFFTQKTGSSWRDLGFRRPGSIVKEIQIGLAGYVAVIPIFLVLLVFLIILSSFFSYQPAAHPLMNVFLEEQRKSPFALYYSFFLACVLAPIFEEIFFRGFCYSLFKNKWGKQWAMALSAAFFAIMHMNPFAFLPIFALGLGLSYLYETRRSLVPCIVLHMIHNSFLIGYFFLTKHLIMPS